jgi:hypothetical protein
MEKECADMQAIKNAARLSPMTAVFQRITFDEVNAAKITKNTTNLKRRRQRKEKTVPSVPA